MNLPNKLTLLRALLILPVAVLTLGAPDGGWPLWLCAGLCFGIAAITDTIDGSIARKRNMVTDFGKLMDPVADKLLVTTAMVCFLSMNICPAWVLIVVLAREFLVTSIRMVASGKGMVIAANVWGKVKTIIQMIAIGVAYACEFGRGLAESLGAAPDLLPTLERYAVLTEYGAFTLAAAVTIVSGVVYVSRSRQFFTDTK